MVALAPLFTIRRFGTIASISADDRRRVLEVLITSPIYVVRQLAMSFKAVATLLYAKSDAVRAAMATPVAAKQLDEALANQPGAKPDESMRLISATRLVSRTGAGAKAQAQAQAQKQSARGGSRVDAA